LFAQHSVPFSNVVDQLQLLLAHPATHCDQQEPERVQGFCHEEANIITGSPTVHRPVGDPLQIYADRFSGHFGQTRKKLAISESCKSLMSFCAAWIAKTRSHAFSARSSFLTIRLLDRLDLVDRPCR
jgi:hypothetical protein